MKKLSPFATLVTAALIGIAAESAWSDEPGPSSPARQTPAPMNGFVPGQYPPANRGGYAQPWQQPSQYRPVAPAMQAPAPMTGSVPGQYPPQSRGGYAQPWQQPSQWPVPQRGYAQSPPPYPPQAQYQATPAAPVVVENPLSTELKHAQEQLTAKSTELDKTHAALEQLREKLQQRFETELALNEKMANITNEQLALHERVIKLTAELNATSATQEQNRQKIRTDQQQKQMLTTERDQLLSELAGRDKQLAMLQAELQTVTQALEQARSEATTTGQLLAKTRAQAEMLNNKLSELTSQLESQKTTQLKTVQPLTAERDRLRIELAGRDKQLAALQAELQTVTQALEQARSEATSTDQLLGKTRAQTEMLNNKLSELNTQLGSQKTTLLQAVQPLTAERDSLRSDLASRDKQLAELQAELQTVTQDLEQARSEATSTDQLLGKTRAQTEMLNNKLSELNTQLGSQKTTLLQAVQPLTAERDSLRSDLASRDKQLAELQAELQTVTQDLQQARSEATRSSQLARKNSALAETLKDKTDEPVTGPGNQKTTPPDPKKTLTSVNTGCDSLQADLSACSRNLSQARNAVATAHSEVAALLRTRPTTARLSVDPHSPDLVKPTTSIGLISGTVTVAVPENPTMDADADGLPDSVDLCLGTPQGIVVDSTGCAAGVAITLEDVNFLFNSHQLTRKARGILNRVADILIKQPDLRLEVAGHTDAQGNPSYNKWLSLKRAEAVRNYLVAQGVNPEHLGAAGYGGLRPIAKNTTREGLRKNRRVELRRLN